MITKSQPLCPALVSKIDAYWRASNFLSVGQIYLLDNPLLRAPLRREHVKPRLLGHWGTSHGLNLLYVHLNRIIVAHDLSVLFITIDAMGTQGMLPRPVLRLGTLNTASRLNPGLNVLTQNVRFRDIELRPRNRKSQPDFLRLVMSSCLLEAMDCPPRSNDRHQKGCEQRLGQ